MIDSQRKRISLTRQHGIFTKPASFVFEVSRSRVILLLPVMPSEKLEKKSKIVIEKFKMDPQIRQNNSQQDLVPDGEDVSDQNEKTLKDVKFREWIAVLILCFVNLINYMDRFTIAGESIYLSTT